jgi:hypothetical protein
MARLVARWFAVTEGWVGTAISLHAKSVEFQLCPFNGADQISDAYKT